MVTSVPPGLRRKHKRSRVGFGFMRNPSSLRNERTNETCVSAHYSVFVPNRRSWSRAIICACLPGSACP